MPVKSYKQKKSLKLMQGVNLALILSVLFSFIYFNRGEQKSSLNSSVTKPTFVAEYDTRSIPVPVSVVPAGTSVRDIEFEYVAFPKHQLPSEAITSTASYLNAVTVTALPAKLPLFKSNLSFTAHKTNPVLERIPPGMRAITLRVDATSAVEGWAGSGALVDVLLVEKDQTIVVAEQVKILSAERSVIPVEGAVSPAIPSTVTVLVTQDQALAINTAVLRGKIAFALRSIGDDKNWKNRVYTADRLNKNHNRIITAVKGYFTIGKGKSQKSFALANGQWIEAKTTSNAYRLAGLRQ